MCYPKLLSIFTGVFLLPVLLCAQKLAPGPQVLTFFSSVDDTEQPYGIYIPKNYDPSTKYPLVIMLHGAGSNHRLALRRVFGKSNVGGETDVEASRYFPEWKDVEYVVASPYARGTAGYQGVAEKDVYDVLADVKRRFNIDEDRTFLTGLSMGGGGTLWIGLTRPDLWAALAPVCPAPPRGTDQYLPNSLNIPMHFHHGDADRAVPVSVSRDWVKNLKENGTHVEYTEYPGVEHNSWENAYADEAIFRWFDQHQRNPYPDQVKFSTNRYEYNRAYWVTFDKISPGTTASIDVKFTDENVLSITTSQLGAFTLRLAGHPKYKSAARLQITLNGQKLKTPNAGTISFLSKDGEWAIQRYSAPEVAKRPGLEGPISAAFADRHVYVYGTSGNPSAEELSTRQTIATTAADWSVYRNAFLGRVMVFPRVLADKDVRTSDLESANLILFGTRETNSIIAKISDRLPMHLPSDARNVGLLYVFPVDNRYVVVQSGQPWWITSGKTSSGRPLPFQTTGVFKDYALYKGGSDSIVSEGYFDEGWMLSEAQKAALSGQGVIVK